MATKVARCEEAAPVGTKVIKRIYIDRGGYSYRTDVKGKVVAYRGHVGADFHFYKIKFEAPIYEYSTSLVQTVGEYDLIFPNGQSESEQAKRIMRKK